MQIDYYNSFIPLEVGDIIQPEGYDNKYLLEDILVIHHAKDKTTEVILKLKETDINITILLNYTDFKWKIIKYNTDKEEE